MESVYSWLPELVVVAVIGLAARGIIGALQQEGRLTRERLQRVEEAITEKLTELEEVVSNRGEDQGDLRSVRVDIESMAKDVSSIASSLSSISDDLQSVLNHTDMISSDLSRSRRS